MNNMITTDYSPLLLNPRGWGLTTSLAEVAKNLNGYLICHTEGEVQRVKHTHGCNAFSVDQPNSARGLCGVKIWENLAIEKALRINRDKTEKCLDLLKEIHDTSESKELKSKIMNILGPSTYA